MHSLCRCALRRQAMNHVSSGTRNSKKQQGQGFGAQSFASRLSAKEQGSSGTSPNLQAQCTLVARAHQVSTAATRRNPRASPALSHLPPPRPNPSLKPSTNGKGPGPRYSAGVLLLQRGPGPFPLVPA
jgi:hypothetical protein